MSAQNPHTQRQIDITVDDLPLHCPMPGETIWDAHPRVFLLLTENGEALCPYCGTLYKLHGPVKAHH